MSIDAYSPCPGGSGKKIKFCCNDLLPDLQKIDRMIEGEQYTACLSHIDRLMIDEANCGRACLLAMKCTALDGAGRREELVDAAAEFLEKHPDNQIALAESALLKAEEDARAAFALLLRAMRAAEGNIALQTFQAMAKVAAFLHHRGFPLPARELVLLLCEISPQNRRMRQVLDAFSQTDAVPLLLRDDPPIVPSPDDAPWKDRFEEAWGAYARGDWLTAAESFESLAAETPDSAVVCHAQATLRGLLADNPGCIEALRRFAALRAGEENGLEDAAEAEALAMFLSDDTLGDETETLSVVWTLTDAERAVEKFLSSPRWKVVPFDSARYVAEGVPPPKNVFAILDRPMPESADGFSLESMPRYLGHAFVFGRQTDREARLTMAGMTAEQLPAIAAMVAETAGNAVEPEPKRETLGRLSATRQMLYPPLYPPQGFPDEQLDAMVVEHVSRAVLKQWPEMALGVLEGRSPRQAAADPNSRARLLGAILVLESWLGPLPGEIDCNELRAQLGLPTLDPIDPDVLPLEKISAVRLARVTVERLSDEELIEAYHHAAEFAVRPALRKFSQAIIERPSFADSEEREMAFVTIARTERDVDRAVQHVERGRREALGAGKSCAMWDLMELSFNFARRNAAEASRLIDHIQRRHLKEPGVNEALSQLLIDVGLLRPDGTPAFDPDAMATAAAAAAPQSESADLWTPDSEQSGGGGNLWVPGAE
ncbi:MAG: hypothetical protein JW959_06165 [Pirellulales bacterium]|nr:hypothetical protein [Pirellulales bacterium]